MKPKIIFVPGLGDARHGGLERLLKFSLAGLEVHYLPMIWSKGEFKPKLKLLVDKIDSLSGEGAKVSLLGTSAGASAVVNAFIQRRQKIDKVILVCGKLREHYNYRSPAFTNNPAFKQSMQQLEKSMKSLTTKDKANFLLLYSSGDTTVPPVDAELAGTTTHKLPRLPHVLAIVYALTLGSGKIKKFLAQVA